MSPLFPILCGLSEAAAVRRSVRAGEVVVTHLPWTLIAAHERQAQANHYQSLKRLAERGGLSASEAVAVLEDRKWRSMSFADANKALLAILKDAERAEIAAQGESGEAK